MTIPRVILAAALLILGFMILGIEKSVVKVEQELVAGKDAIVKELGSINKGILTNEDSIAKVYKLTKGKGIISRPRVKPVPCVQRQHSVFDPWFQQSGSQSSHKTPQC